MSKERSRLPPSFSVTVGMKATIETVRDNLEPVGTRLRHGSAGLLLGAAQGRQGKPAAGAAQIRSRPRPRTPYKALLWPSRVPLRGVAPHWRGPAGDRPAFRRLGRRQPAGVRLFP